MLPRGSSAASGVLLALLDGSGIAGSACAAWSCPAVATSISRQCSTALPSLKTEQDRKNFEILKYLAQRPVDTAFRIGALAGLGVVTRDLSLVLNSIYQKDVRGIDHPEIAAQEVKNTIQIIQALGRDKNVELQHQLKLHIARIIPELDHLNIRSGRAAARRKVALCSRHDQEVIHRLFPQLLVEPVEAMADKQHATAAATGDGTVAARVAVGEPGGLSDSADGAVAADAVAGGSEVAGAVDELDAAFASARSSSSRSSSGHDASGALLGGPTADSGIEDLGHGGALAREARIMHASGRFSRVRFPVWDVTKLDDGPATGQAFRPRHMNRLPWMALLPPHLEVSYQTMTAIPLFPMQEVVYPEFVDVDYAMYYLSRYARRYKRSRSRVRSPRR